MRTRPDTICPACGHRFDKPQVPDTTLDIHLVDSFEEYLEVKQKLFALVNIPLEKDR